MSTSSSLPGSVAAQPARRSLLKRLAGLTAGSFLAAPLQALLGRTTPAAAGTLAGGDTFLGEIIMAGFDFPPTGYMPCDGQIMPIRNNTALFALLGTYYGGDGKSTFALPNLNGRVPIGAGQGQGLSNYNLADASGEETHTLLATEIPVHTHTAQLTYSTVLGTTDSPAGAFLASNASGLAQYEPTGTGTPIAIDTGSAQPHNNMQPYLTIGYYICVQGVFPSRQ